MLKDHKNKHYVQRSGRVHHKWEDGRIKDEEQILQKHSWFIKNEKHLAYWLAHVITELCRSA